MKSPHLVLFISGLMFGLGLAFSGMTDASRVIGFLDVSGAWDPSLLFVMAGAVTTFGLGLLLWRRVRGATGWFGISLPGKDNDPVDRYLVVGSAIFGVGWGLSGFCPGPALANLGGWRTEALVFIPAMAAGMWIARAAFKVDCD